MAALAAASQQLLEYLLRSGAIGLGKEDIPDPAIANLLEGEASRLFACPIESDDAAERIEDEDQGADRVEDCRDEIPFVVERALRLLEIRLV